MEPKHRMNTAIHGTKHPLPVKVPETNIDRSCAISKDVIKQLKNQYGLLVHLWLKTGRHFWYYLVKIEHGKVYGYEWRRGHWVPYMIPTYLVVAYY